MKKHVSSMEIRKLRETLGLSRNGFAEKCGLPVSTIQNFEEGTKECPEEFFEILKSSINEGTTGKNTIKIGISVDAIIEDLYSHLDSPWGKAQLAKLWRSTREPDPSEAYSVIFAMMPEELFGSTNELSDEEKAVLWSLQSYALLQLGRGDPVHSKSKAGPNLGSSLSKLRTGAYSGIADHRFNAMILADTEEEFLRQLHDMIRVYKSRIKNGTVDFAMLAMDIYRFIHWENGEEKIRMTWSMEYYKR